MPPSGQTGPQALLVEHFMCQHFSSCTHTSHTHTHIGGTSEPCLSVGGTKHFPADPKEVKQIAQGLTGGESTSKAIVKFGHKGLCFQRADYSAGPTSLSQDQGPHPWPEAEMGQTGPVSHQQE